MPDRSSFSVTSRTRVQRKPDRASYDRALAYAILDEALVASVAFSMGDAPCIIPMAFARLGDRLVLHGASSSRLQRLLGTGAPVCVNVTLVDGVVLSRSAMHHSMNYRSVVIFGRAEELTSAAEKREALARLVNHVLPGRSSATRPPSELELRATRVFAVPLEEVSVKRREGGPIEDADDLELPYWGGVIPLELRASAPLADPVHAPSVPAPGGAADYDRKGVVRSALA